MPIWLVWIIGVLSSALFVLLVVFNGWTVVNYFRTHQHVSAIPFLGGIMGVVAMLTLPIKDLRPWWWLPLMLDYGSVPMFVYFFIWHLTSGLRNAGKH